MLKRIHGDDSKHPSLVKAQQKFDDAEAALLASSGW